MPNIGPKATGSTSAAGHISAAGHGCRPYQNDGTNHIHHILPVRPQALDIWSVRPQAFQRTRNRTLVGLPAGQATVRPHASGQFGHRPLVGSPIMDVDKMRIMAASWRLERQRIIVIVTIIIIIIIIVVVVIVVIVVVVVVSIALVIIIIIRSLFGLETTLPQESRARASRRTPWMHLTFPTPVAHRC